MKAVVLLSGGLDSSTVAYGARASGFQLHCMSFDYDQKHKRELDSARKVAAVLGAEHRIVTLGLAKGASSLLSSGAPVADGIVDRKDIPETYVPGRNLIFLAIAASYAESIGAMDIFAGMNAIDYSGYPDCRPEFIRSLEQTLNVGTRSAVQGHPFTLHTPLIGMTKKEIVLKGQELGVDFALTWSCYRGGEKPCGRCDSCLLRAKGFREAGLPDPAVSR